MRHPTRQEKCRAVLKFRLNDIEYGNIDSFIALFSFAFSNAEPITERTRSIQSVPRLISGDREERRDLAATTGSGCQFVNNSCGLDATVRRQDSPVEKCKERHRGLLSTSHSRLNSTSAAFHGEVTHTYFHLLQGTFALLQASECDWLALNAASSYI